MTSSAAICQAYEEVQELVYNIALRFWRKYKGDLEEIIGEAHEHYMVAYHSYDPSKSSFETWVTCKVGKGLLETKRTAARRAKKHQPLYDVADDHRDFDFDKFLADLPPKAAQAVQLFMEHKEFHIDEECDQRSCPRFCTGFMNYLRSIGWTTQVILESFSEIAQALRG